MEVVEARLTPYRDNPDNDRAEEGKPSAHKARCQQASNGMFGRRMFTSGTSIGESALTKDPTRGRIPRDTHMELLLVIIIVGAFIAGIVWALFAREAEIGRCYLCQSPTALDNRCEFCGRKICSARECAVWVRKVTKLRGSNHALNVRGLVVSSNSDWPF